MNVLTPYTDRLFTIIHRYPKAVVFASLAGLTIPWTIDNYNKWLSLGKGGLPYNVFGWLAAMVVHPFRRETFSTMEYIKDGNKDTWIDPTVIPERRGARPLTSWHCIPHRQIDRLPAPSYGEKIVAIFNKHAEANSNLVKVVISPHERTNNAMVIHPDIPSPHKVAERGLREIVHIHPYDYSLHAILAPLDCQLVVEKGWGERHPLSGVIPILPKEYLIIYAPRDEEELQVVERVIVASIGYMTNNRDVK